MRDCGCGYYGLASCDPFVVRLAGYGVPARVWGYGKVVVHEAGWRAERLQVLGLYPPLCAFACGRPAAKAYPVADAMHFACGDPRCESAYTLRTHNVAPRVVTVEVLSRLITRRYGVPWFDKPVGVS